MISASISDRARPTLTCNYNFCNLRNSCNLCRYAALAASSGVRSFIRVPTLGLEPEFIDALASVVMEALPDLNQPSMQQAAEIYRDTPRSPSRPTYQPAYLP